MASNLTEYTVSELSFALKRTVEGAYGLVRVRGEISGFKRAASGHSYFALKDDRAVLDAVAWKGSQRRLGFQPEDGLEVICTGNLTTYPGRSKYQLIVEQMEPAGAGALMALLEERKKRLAEQGLFDPARKRPLPFLPDVVGVITSPTGAVIRDILHRIADRFPLRVIVWPVPVQGEGAAAQIAAAIDGMGRLGPAEEPPRPDVLIVARGGGSIEDLWAFNEEVVALAAARCPIPLVSAVGHETDTTLLDFVADRRAPTPTAAAEMAVPVRRELMLQLDGLGGRGDQAIAGRIDLLRHRVTGLARGLPEPRLLVAQAIQRLDDLGERLHRAAATQLERRAALLARLVAGLRPPAQTLAAARQTLAIRHARIGECLSDALGRAGRDLRLLSGRLRAIPWDVGAELAAARVESATGRLAGCVTRGLGERQQRLAALAQLADSLAPTRVLERGYAIVRTGPAGPVVTTRLAAGAHRELEITFVDGTVPVIRAEPPARGKGSGGSGSRGPAPAPAQETLL